jgi:dihydrofolate reductase
MARVTYKTATSIDGFIADDKHSLDWLFKVDRSAGAPDHNGFMASVGAIVEGSTTYEWVLRETDVLAHPGRWREYYGSRPTFVFTSRQLPVPDGADVRFVSGPVQDALPAIRAAAGEMEIWVVGGGDLAGQFVDVGALDRLIFTVAPVALGSGAPLIPRRIDADRLSLVAVERHGHFVEITYSVGPPLDERDAENLAAS